MRICKSDYILKSLKIDNISIAHIADIHFDIPYNLEILEKIPQKIKEMNPDYICVTGDIVDNNGVLDNPKQYQIIHNFFKNLCSISKVIVTLGNHEMQGKKNIVNNYNEILNKLRKISTLIVLDNENYIDNNICFTGFNLSHEYYKLKDEKYNLFIEEFNKLNLKLDKNKYNVLLIHTPEDLLSDNIYNSVKDFELILAGHTHGGMMPIKMKGHNGISAGNRWFPKNVRGHLKRNNTNLIICSGIVRLSNSTRFFRHFNWLYASHINKIMVKKQ